MPLKLFGRGALSVLPPFAAAPGAPAAPVAADAAPVPAVDPEAAPPPAAPLAAAAAAAFGVSADGGPPAAAPAAVVGRALLPDADAGAPGLTAGFSAEVPPRAAAVTTGVAGADVPGDRDGAMAGEECAAGPAAVHAGLGGAGGVAPLPLPVTAVPEGATAEDSTTPLAALPAGGGCGGCACDADSRPAAAPLCEGVRGGC